MASEEQEMLLKISQLAGQINRHKNGQPADHQTHYTPPSSVDSRGNFSQGWRSSRGAYSARGYGRGGRPVTVHRHRSLVLNGNTSLSAILTENIPPTRGDTEESNGSAPAYVAKIGRHLQLINTSIYERDTQTRAKAIEETRKHKLKQRHDREKAKFFKHIQRLGGNIATTVPVQPAANYEIEVQGIRFRVTKNGSKLAKVAGDFNAAKSTPKIALVGGVKFYRTKNGNMYRSSIVKANRYGQPLNHYGMLNFTHLKDAESFDTRNTGVAKKINEPCKAFSTTGSCANGPRCRYNHDPTMVAVCREFLQKGSCPSGDSCDLSHVLIPERTPACLHFAKGNCSNPNCHYSHVRVSPSAPVCRPFGIYGYCEKGANCEERHVHECPDFSNTGKCFTKGCKLPHRHKASVMRTNAEEKNSDMSSDEDDEVIDSDDVDSDDLDEEFFGDEGGNTDSDVPIQRDYVQFS